jgi:hypothetical protein
LTVGKEKNFGSEESMLAKNYWITDEVSYF